MELDFHQVGPYLKQNGIGKLYIIKEGTPWVHLDIAGTTWSKKVKPVVPKGGTGYGVRLLDRVVADHYETK